MADGAADPLADTDIYDKFVRYCRDERINLCGAERTYVLAFFEDIVTEERARRVAAEAALDAERAEHERARRWGEDAARAAMRNRELHDQACEEIERQKARAERAEAAIARARAAPEAVHSVLCPNGAGNTFPTCLCGAEGFNRCRAAALAALETETPA